MRARRAGLLALGLAGATLWVLACAADPYEPFAEGNRRFRRGELEGAFAAYAAAYEPAHPDPRLAYNLGATAHRLGRLPEAVLWYRRTLAASPLPSPARRWAADNLELARQALATSRVHPTGAAWWAARRGAFLLAGCLLAWAALLAELASLPIMRRHRAARGVRLGALALGAAGALLFAAGWLLAARGPREAVLLARCGGLPEGSEVWVSPDDERSASPRGSFRLLGAPDEPSCPAATVGLVEP